MHIDYVARVKVIHVLHACNIELYSMLDMCYVREELLLRRV